MATEETYLKARKAGGKEYERFIGKISASRGQSALQKPSLPPVAPTELSAENVAVFNTHAGAVRHPGLKLDIPPQLFCMRWCPDFEFRGTQDGVLVPEEAAAMMTELMSLKTPAAADGPQMRQLYIRYDADHDTQLDLQEWTVAYKALLGGKKKR